MSVTTSSQERSRVFPRSAWEHGVALFLLLGMLRASYAQENWDRFRGSNGAGQSDAESIPSEWREENVLWKRSLPGIGHSSPVVWGERLFVTSGDRETGDQIVQAVGALNGALLWEHIFAGPTYSIHTQNSYASSTPALDDQRVYVMWLGDGGIKLAALTHAGEAVWQREVGPFGEQHGFGKSPLVVDGLVIVAGESEAESAIVAFDCRTGEDRWQTARPSGTTSFSTPCLFDPAAGRKLLVTASTASGLTALDAATGKVAFRGDADAFPVRCVASPIVAEGLIFATCGEGGNGKHLVAAKPASDGRLEETYRLKEGVPQVPTPVAAGDLLFLWHDRGIVSCVDAATGDVHWRQRIGGNYSSSPVRVGKRIFGTSTDGEVIVLAADKEYQLLARNSLGEPTRATPAIAHDRMYLRTEESLMCIGAKDKKL